MHFLHMTQADEALEFIKKHMQVEYALQIWSPKVYLNGKVSGWKVFP